MQCILYKISRGNETDFLCKFNVHTFHSQIKFISNKQCLIILSYLISHPKL